jgi:hypothetical protein
MLEDVHDDVRLDSAFRRASVTSRKEQADAALPRHMSRR